jgi:hypothetical protein
VAPTRPCLPKRGQRRWMRPCILSWNGARHVWPTRSLASRSEARSESPRLRSLRHPPLLGSPAGGIEHKYGPSSLPLDVQSPGQTTMDAPFNMMDQARQAQPENYVVWQPYRAIQESDVVRQGQQAYTGWYAPFPGKATTQESIDGYAINHYGPPLGLPIFDSGLRYPMAMTGNLVLHPATACDVAGSTELLYAIPSSRGMEHGGVSAGAALGGFSVVPHANIFVWVARTRYTGEMVRVCMMDRVLSSRMACPYCCCCTIA